MEDFVMMDAAMPAMPAQALKIPRYIWTLATDLDVGREKQS